MRYEKQCARKSTGGRAPSKQGLERPLSDSSDEEEEKEAVQRPESASGSSSDDEEVAEGEGEPTVGVEL